MKAKRAKPDTANALKSYFDFPYLDFRYRLLVMCGADQRAGWLLGAKARREESPGFTGSGCWLTASEGNLRESATENKPPERAWPLRSAMTGKGETVR